MTELSAARMIEKIVRGLRATSRRFATAAATKGPARPARCLARCLAQVGPRLAPGTVVIVEETRFRVRPVRAEI